MYEKWKLGLATPAARRSLLSVNSGSLDHTSFSTNPESQLYESAMESTLEDIE